MPDKWPELPEEYKNDIPTEAALMRHALAHDGAILVIQPGTYNPPPDMGMTPEEIAARNRYYKIEHAVAWQDMGRRAARYHNYLFLEIATRIKHLSPELSWDEARAEAKAQVETIESTLNDDAAHDRRDYEKMW